MSSMPEDVEEGISRETGDEAGVVHTVEDVIILNADFKWRDGQLSILEIADGISYSGYCGYNELYGDDSKDEVMFKRIFDKLALRFQTIYVVHHTTKNTNQEIPVAQLNSSNINIIAFDTYFEFIDHIKSKKTNIANSILVVGENPRATPSNFAPRTISEVKAFLKKQGIKIPVVNSSEMFDFADDKIIFNMVCPGGVPNSFIISPNDVLKKINLFLSKSESCYVILKPPAEHKGKGIRIVKRDELMRLQSQLCENGNDIKQVPMFSSLLEKYGYFLIQDYVNSNEMLVDNRRYDPTGRAVLILYKRETGHYSVEFVDAYWKLPKQSLEAGICQASQISYIGESDTVCSAVLSQSDKSKINFEFKKFFKSPINMFSTGLHFLRNHYFSIQDDEQRYFRHKLQEYRANITSMNVFRNIQGMGKRFSFRFDKILLKNFILMVRNYHLETEKRPDLTLCIDEIAHLLHYLVDEQCSNKLLLPYTSMKGELFMLKRCLPPSMLQDHEKLLEKIKQSELTFKRLMEYYKLKSDSSLELAKGLRNAAASGRVDDLLLFLELVEDVNEQDGNPEKKYTALHWAVEKKAYPCVKALLENGAKFTVENVSGKAVQQIIEESEDITLNELFITAVAYVAQLSQETGERASKSLHWSYPQSSVAPDSHSEDLGNAYRRNYGKGRG